MQFCVAAHYNFLILFSWHQRLTQGDSDQNELLKCLKITQKMAFFNFGLFHQFLSN